MFTDELIAEASQLFKVHPRDILGPYKFGFIMPARFAVYKALRARGWSYPRIGKYFKRDHTTALHGVRQADYLAERDPEYADKINRLVEMSVTPYEEFEKEESLD